MAIYRWFTHEKWWFFIAMLVYQRVISIYWTYIHISPFIAGEAFQKMSPRFPNRIFLGPNMYYISGLSAGRAIQRERHCRVRPSSLCLGTLHHDLHLWHWQLDHRLEKITLEIIQKTHLPGLVNIQKTMERSTIFKFGKSTISMCNFQ